LRKFKRGQWRRNKKIIRGRSPELIDPETKQMECCALGTKKVGGILITPEEYELKLKNNV
jgi:hypothetical protein